MRGIEFSGVSFGYSSTDSQDILKDVSFQLDEGRITLLTGPSGCGKSTVLYLAAGIYPQNGGFLKRGEIRLDGQDPSSLPPDQRCRLVGMMFQNPSLQFCMDTVEHEILFCLGNIQVPQENMAERLQAALDFCEIQHLRKRRLQTLSGGEKQKAMLACLFALRPKWLLLDEPFANVDEASAKELTQKLLQLHHQNVSILVVDHLLDHWLPIADEIRFMSTGSEIDPKRFSPSEILPEVLQEKGILSLAEPIRLPVQRAETPSSQTILELRNLTISRGDRVLLNGINFSFQSGKKYAILGKSGSGKSSLFQAIGGSCRYKGNIQIQGRSLRKLLSLRAGTVGFVTQEAQDQFVAPTVLEEIQVGLKQGRTPKKQGGKEESILRGIGLWGHRNFSPYNLSQGQQRRLGVAALLSYDCSLLICDEPTYAQDLKNATAIMNELAEKVESQRLTLIFSTHDRRLAEKYADCILEIKEGRLSPREWVESPV